MQAFGERGRRESEAERLDRNLVELLQELRVASLGVQVLFGFLLTIPFTTTFSRLDRAQEALYTADLLLAAMAAALLTAPVAQHRLRFRHHQKAQVLRFANAAAIAGLVAVAFAISGSVLLVVSLLWDGLLVWIVSFATALAICVLWFALPLVHDKPDEY
jgi:uncharacterized protein DUF6328